MTSPLVDHMAHFLEPPDPYDWRNVVRAVGFFAAVLLIADLLF